ncbi:MAG TPA: type II toxin-antitoxin system ParD family antitoxin [Planctomycetota bacterium]|nr:type II toxin-antitoxin system ParD family antitoxin [Planctomycetota bacterium]
MNVHLTPELKKLVEDEVASGQYASASEVIREGLRLLVEERRWREEVRSKIADGVAEAKAGKLVHGEPAFERLRARIESRRQVE